MRVIFLIIVLIHGLIHIIGFVKAFGFKEVKELALPISKPVGIVWLIAALLFLFYGFLYLVNNKNSWLFGIIAVVVSQILIFYFWQDAKYGTLPNLIILVAILFSYGNARFAALVENERKEILLKSKSQNTEVFSETEIQNLPNPVRKWLTSSGAIGKPKTLNGKIVQKALMKMKPEQDDWYPATALQYTVINEPSFIWTVDLKMNSFMWVKGRDKFQDGKGQMLIKVNSLVNVVNESGEKIDEGTIQRYLGEMVWFPSLAVSPYVSWEEIDEKSGKATMEYKNAKGSGTFYFNEEGDFVKFTAMRFQGNEPEAKRKEWILTVDDYGVFEGVKVPSKMKATWKLEDQDWTWLQLEIEEIEYNVKLK